MPLPRLFLFSSRRDHTRNFFARRTSISCHPRAALYKQSCRELYVAGHHKSGSYIIDVDRNGRLPPGRVECAMAENFTQTTILHNAPNEIVKMDYLGRKLYDLIVFSLSFLTRL